MCSCENSNTASLRNLMKGDPNDLSSLGTANCYMVSEVGLYKFPTVKGNTSVPVGNVASCEVLWESFGTDVVPSVGDVVKSVRYEDGYVFFQTPATFTEGNALIAAKDASGTILWSWHIWCTKLPVVDKEYSSDTPMQYRLGTVYVINADGIPVLPKEGGLVYQWGRKDPFPGYFYTGQKIAATVELPTMEVISTSRTGTINYSIANPTTYIRASGYWDWCFSYPSKCSNAIRWLSYPKPKSIYDPCPPGWRVSDEKSQDHWSTDVNTDTRLFVKASVRCMKESIEQENGQKNQIEEERIPITQDIPPAPPAEIKIPSLVLNYRVEGENGEWWMDYYRPILDYDADPFQDLYILEDNDDNLVVEIYDYVEVVEEEVEEEVEEKAIPFQLVEEKPLFKGGDVNTFTKWVNERIVYPEIARENGVQGRVTLEFTVEKDGRVTKVNVLRGVDPSLDKEAVRVVSMSPKWKPGRQRGRAIAVKYTFPVTFNYN